MKKVIKILGLAAIIMAMSMNINNSSSDSNLKFSDLTLQSLVTSAHAQDECNSDGTCVPVDCPWWNPFCDDWENSDGVSYEEYPSPFCTTQITDCYPGTSSCTEVNQTDCL